MKRRIDSWFDSLSDLQVRRAWWFIAIATLLSAFSVPLVGQLGLNSAWTALLPDDKISVRDLEKVKDRVGGLSTLTVAIQSKDLAAMQRLARDLVPRLQALPTKSVRAVDWNVGAYEHFVEKHRHLYGDLDELRDIRDGLQDRLDYEKRVANPFYVDLEGGPPEALDATVKRIEARAAAGRGKLKRFPDGFYVHPKRDLLVIFVRADLTGGDNIGGKALVDMVQRQVNALHPQRYAPDLRVDYAGDVLLIQEEHRSIAEELAIATSLTVLLVLAAIYVFFRRWRALAMLGLALVPPVLVTFAAAELLVDFLNTSTAFLASIVIGNGINPSIIWLARYFEERRNGGDVRTAIALTHRGTRLATWTASTAAAIAYGSLVVTDFRGFRDFGIIGGIGMVLCWVSALLLLPPLCAVFEHVPSLRREPSLQGDAVYGRWLWRWIYAAPRTITVVSLALALTSLVLVGFAIAADPIEYDFRKLKSVRDNSTQALRIQARIGDIISSTEQGNGIAMLLPNRQLAPLVRAGLEHRRDREGAPFGPVRSIDSLLPGDQPAKLPVLADIRRLMLELRPHATAEQQRSIDAQLPPERIVLVSDADLPAEVVRPFSEKDGTRGTILLVENAAKRFSIWDGRYLMKWAAALRAVRLPDGSRPPLAGRAPVFADMVEAVQADGPKAVLVSFLAVVVLTLLTFRGLRERLVTILALLVGIAWMGGAMVLMRLKLNFLNFVAFPITFGNGVDYVVNVLRRYRIDRKAGKPDAVRHAVEETGGAVILCSLTTIIGYASLHASSNLALNSFGEVMAISEFACLIAAVVTAPALLVWIEQHQRARQSTRAPRELAIRKEGGVTTPATAAATTTVAANTISTAASTSSPPH